MSLLEGYLAWSQVHGRARGILDRLTALAVKVELVAESVALTRGRAGVALEEIRVQIECAALDAKAIASDTARQIPTPGVTELGEVVLDTLAALERSLRLREVSCQLPRIPRGTRVAIEPEILSATIAVAFDVLVEPALPSERLSISHEAGAGSELLRIALETRSEVVELPAAEAKLLALRPWIELRGGRVDVRAARTSLCVEIELPSVLGDRC